MLPYPHDAGHHCGNKLDQKFRLPENGDIDQIKAGIKIDTLTITVLNLDSSAYCTLHLLFK